MSNGTTEEAAMRTFRRYAIVALAVIGLGVSAPVQARSTQSTDFPTGNAHFPGTASWRASHTSDLLGGKELRALLANAQTSADHVRLQKHFLAVAAKSDAKETEHSAMAENRNLGSHFPGTVSWRARHCDRIARSGREAAKEARSLASEHEHMAAGSN
jgi:hypothetical protein